MLRALLILLVLPPYVVVASLLGYPLARLRGSSALLYRLGRFGSRVLLFLAGTRIVVEGLEHLGDARNTVLMPNHASHLDGPILIVALGVDFKAVAKTEVFRIPFFRHCLRFAGFVEVNRSDPDQSKRAIASVVGALQAGSCFVIFPEGTRTQTGDLGAFKKGGFVVAIEAKARIVPVALIGARSRLPRGSLGVRPGTVRVKVLDPVDAGGYSYETRDALISLVRGRIAATLAEGEGA